MIKKTCKQCGKEFTLTDSEIAFYKSKKLDLPKRCSECREKNKNSKSIENNNVNTTENINNNNNNNIKIENSSNNNNRNKKTFRNILLALLLLAVLVLGKVFGLPIEKIIPNGFAENEQTISQLQFRSEQRLEEHFEKHKSEFKYDTKEEYVAGANYVISSPESLHKIESEDGDEIFYNEEKNEIVFISEDGYIRTYFKPSDGINYFNRQ